MTEEDSEKRFHSVMDKLFNSPKPNSNSSRGKKRRSSVLSGESNDSGRSIVAKSGLSRALVPSRSLSSSTSSEVVPMCRPWDRGDFTRRLATFKSMTWFGKPKVVSAVNCVRRGWINVEMDIIACEACGSRLLFSNPSSWTQQQIEKAAAVFSLKLDNGHKLLCPWRDNACDESLAQFPPTPAPALIDGYRERFSALSQLSALPIISASAIDCMRCPQLERFLEQSSKDFHNGSIHTTSTESLDYEHTASANLYYQAQKLISLCGWEPRSLPYAVDCNDWSTQAAQNGHSEEMSPHIANVPNPGVVMYSMPGIDDVVVVEDGPSLNALQSDPASVVLDCKLCGASAGLWAFSTIPRPLEWFRIVESLEVNGQNDTGNGDANMIACIAGAPRLDESGKSNVDRNGGTLGTPILTNDRSLSLNLSIAGGPPPEKQNYRATVSLPIISRHMRVALSSKSDIRNCLMSNAISVDHQTIPCNTNSLQQKYGHITPCKVQSEDMGSSAQEKNKDGLDVSGGNDHSCLNADDHPRNDNNDDTSLEGCFVVEQGAPSRHALDVCSDSRMESPVKSSQKMSQSSGRNDENAGGTGIAEMCVQNGSQGKECNGIVPNANGTVNNPKLIENSPSVLSMAEVSIHLSSEVSSEAKQAAVSSSSLEVDAIVDIACTMNLQKDDIDSNHQKSLDLEGTSKEVEGVKNSMQLTVSNEEDNVAVHEFVKDSKRVQLGRAMEFDPIWQHRHFCPWIVSTGKSGPGWRFTLSALDRDKASTISALDLENPRPLLNSPSSSMFEVDDPITSVRNLFKSPSAKRFKTSRDSR